MIEAKQTAAEDELARGAELQRLFELCRERHPDEWHILLRTECAGREAAAFEALTLLVAAARLPIAETARTTSA